jgi:hypothetical protein
MDMFAGGPPPTWKSPHEDGTLRTTDDLEQLRQALCGEVEQERAYANLRRFLPQSIASATDPSTAPDRGHPTSYVICEQEQAFSPAAQEQMAAAADHRPARTALLRLTADDAACGTRSSTSFAVRSTERDGTSAPRNLQCCGCAASAP